MTRTGWRQRLLSAALVLAVVTIPPVVLVSWVGFPLPSGWPDGQQVRQFLAQPLTAQALSGALAVLAWLVWLGVAVTVVVTVGRRLHAAARRLRQMPLPTPMQATAGGMAGAAVFGVGAGHAGPPIDVDDRAPAAVGMTGQRVSEDPADNGRWASASRGDGLGGVTLPGGGGWLPAGVAEQVAAAAGLWWLRRRRDYQPDPSPVRDDADLIPLPPTAAAIQMAVAHTGQLGSQGAVLQGGDPTGAAPLVLPGGLPTGGVGLVGPGAADAIRGVLVAQLMASRAGDDRTRIITTGEVVAKILGPRVGLLETVATVRVVDPTTAVEEFEALAQADAPSADPLGDLRGSGLPVLVTHAPSGGDVTRLAAILSGAASPGTAVFWGAWAGSTWHVDATGHVRDLGRADILRGRLCVLHATAATDLLTLLAHTTVELRPSLARRGPATNTRQAPTSRTTGSGGDELTNSDSEGRHRQGDEGTQVKVRLLGGIGVSYDGVPVTIRRSAAVQVLAFLATHPEGADGRQLIEAIWPGLPAHTLTGRLYTTVSELRKNLPTVEGRVVVDRMQDRYRLRPDDVRVDLWHLREQARRAATALTGAERRVQWRAVVDDYPGEVAAGHDWPWLGPVRESTRRDILDAYVGLAGAAGDAATALTLLQDAIGVDPLNEDLHHRAARLLTERGDGETAEVLLNAYHRRLVEAGVQPGKTLRQAGIASPTGPERQTGQADLRSAYGPLHRPDTA